MALTKPEIIRAEIGRRIVAGEIQPDIPPAFQDLFQRSRYKVWYGGRGSGKSWSMARVLVAMAARRKLRILCAREFQKTLEDSVHKLLCDQVIALGLSAFYHITDETIYCKLTGSTFRFIGLKNARSIKGAESIDIVWVEEAEYVSAASWGTLTPTMRKKGAEIWVSFNPNLETDPTYKRLILHPHPRAITKLVTWRDNPHISRDLLEEKDHLLQVDPDAFQWVWEGKCRKSTKAQVLAGKCRFDAFTVPEGAQGPYMGSDWGYAQDPTTLVKMWIAGATGKSQGTLYVEHESYKIGLELNDIGAYWNATVPGIDRNLIRGDCARPDIVSHVGRQGFNITSAEKWPGSVEDGVAVLRAFDEIVIHTRCEHAIEESLLWSYETDPLTQEVRPKLVDKHNHIWDAVRYGLAPIIKRTIPGRGFLDMIEDDLATRAHTDIQPAIYAEDPFA